MPFDKDSLSQDEVLQLEKLGKLVRGDILKMTTLARSGHPGGSMSSCDIYLVVWKYARINPLDPDWEDRDRIVVSHGHTSPGVYSVLGRLGFFNIDDAIAYFRLAGSPFEGHVEREIPGVEWTTGNLGQGLSAGIGFALAARLLKKNYHVFVLMSDAEQAKGQVAEARRIARKYNLTNITVVIDYNDKQISGNAHEVMPVDIKANYESDGWKVLEIDGHNYQEIYKAIKRALAEKDYPVCIIAKTVMGKGVSFMENVEAYHGKPLTPDELARALSELGVENNLDFYARKRKTRQFPVFRRRLKYKINFSKPGFKVYSPDERVATRAAIGDQLARIGKANFGQSRYTPFAVFDCDLAESLRFVEFSKQFPDYFFEFGVQEHSTATIAGALSTQGVIGVFGDFGVFGVDETYNQHRLNDINHSNLKLVISHIGIDVGEDGKTHHCIDYIGVLRNLYNFKLIIPGDANQAQRALNYAMSEYGNFAIAVGRSSWPVITDENGLPYYGDNYEFKYGVAEIIRKGCHGTLIAYGPTLARALQIFEILKNKGITLFVINVSTPFSLDKDTLLREEIVNRPVFVYEDHNINTGLGTILSDFYLTMGKCIRIFKFGLENYSVSGPAADLYEINNLSPMKVSDRILDILNDLE